MDNIYESYIIEHHGGGGGHGGGGHGGGGRGYGGRGYGNWGGYGGYYNYPYNYVYINNDKKCGPGYKFDPNNANSDEYGCVKDILEPLIYPMNLNNSKEPVKQNKYIILLLFIIFIILMYFVYKNF